MGSFFVGPFVCLHIRSLHPLNQFEPNLEGRFPMTREYRSFTPEISLSLLIAIVTNFISLGFFNSCNRLPTFLPIKLLLVKMCAVKKTR